jgi:hypothetical protein
VVYAKLCIPDIFTTRILAGRSGVRFPESADFLFFASSRLSLGPTQPSVRWVPGLHSPGVSQSEREVNHILRLMLGLRMTGSLRVLPSECRNGVDRKFSFNFSGSYFDVHKCRYLGTELGIGANVNKM